MVSNTAGVNDLAILNDLKECSIVIGNPKMPCFVDSDQPTLGHTAGGWLRGGCPGD
jgi:hypothetical protein